MTYSIIIPNRFEDIIQPLLKSISLYEQKTPKILIVADGHERDYGYNKVQVKGDFIFAKSANTGINAANQDDIILLNDDVRLLQPDTFKTLHHIAYKDPEIGILSPIVDGGCGNVYMRANRIDLWKDNLTNLHYCKGLRGGDRITFACVYIKRELLNQIGLFDESFTGYGFDDADICIRTAKAGWKLAITNLVKVQHGDGGEVFIRGSNWSTSFIRNRVGRSKQNLNYLRSLHPDIVK